MTEFESCDKCKHSSKAPTEEPCCICTHGTIDYYKPKSNADRIRSMSDEELAEWIHKHDEIVQDFGRMSKTETLQWLKSEAKE